VRDTGEVMGDAMGHAVDESVTSATAAYDGVPVAALARQLGVPRLAAYTVVGSTMDIAHALAEGGAPAGTLVLADEQTKGRGRNARTWVSARGAGIWLTIIERPTDAQAASVLALRLGLAAAQVLDGHATAAVGLKWPNDVYVAGRKVAGVLTEARWQDGRIAWIAIGVGVNLRLPPDVPTGGAIDSGPTRVALLAELVPAIRLAAGAVGALTSDELTEFARRDVARGQRCSRPVAGEVEGIAPTGELLVRQGGEVRAFRSGTLVLAGDPTGDPTGDASTLAADAPEAR
jgi:BirA family transcriptional regulator, biotin operon repressor / biotin---[acetyl-CoA-carboxylase] ligase